MNETNKIYHHTPMQRKDSELCVGICPYYLRDRGNGMVYCECARFRFPDKLARREIVYGFCAHPENYKNLIVRVWGWSGYFVELDKVYQDHIMERMELTI